MMMVDQSRKSTGPRDGLDPTFPRLLGGRLCLDFANTVEDPVGDAPQEFLHDCADLIRWGHHAGLLTASPVASLLDQARRQPEQGAAAFQRALALRDAIDQLFHAIARGEVPAQFDLTTVQQAYLDALTHAQLVPVEKGFDWVRAEQAAHLDSILWSVARSAVELLTGGDLRRVKACREPEGCSWLFYDTSRNLSRRWCSMDGCGTQVKMRRYRARQRAAVTRGRTLLRRTTGRREGTRWR